MSPRLFRPSPALAEHIEYFGYWEGGDRAAAHHSRALPRGAATAIIELGGRTDLGLCAADGRTALSVPPTFIVGAGVSSYVIRIQPAHAVMTIHFRPGRARAFVGCPLGDMEDSCVGLTDLWGSSAERLRARLAETCSATRRVAMLEMFLLDRMGDSGAWLQPDVASVLRRAECDPSMRVSQAQDLTGLAAKRFTALFRSEVGLSPKSYFRVRRLQAALRALDTAAPGAVIAADLGYFDQSHFVREFRTFTAMTPTQYARRRSSMPGHVELGPPKYPSQARALRR